MDILLNIKEEKPVDIRKVLNLISIANTFDNFKKLSGVVKCYEAAKEMLNDNHKPMLLIVGGCGNGKTHLLEAISLGLYGKGIRCPVYTWSEIRRRLLQAMNRPRPGMMDYDTLFDKIRGNEYRLIDDIGMGSKMTDWEISELEDIIDYRYRNRLFTVATSNKTIDELAVLSERIVSRFYDPEVSVVVANMGKDYRIAQCEKQNAR